MINSSLEYRGYHDSVEIDFDDNILFGKVLNINDLVSYKAQSVSD